MKLSNLAYAAIGYTLGARAGRERYEDIVRIARRVGGSQTVQTTAGVLGGQLEHARHTLNARLAGQPAHERANGHQR